jgi:hypothetical protein
VREVFMLFKDWNKADALGRAMEQFSTKYPTWRLDPYQFGNESYPGFDARRTIHHYFLDPRLMVTALVLGESPESLSRVGVTVTGPVLECMLVAMAPLVLVPRDAEFCGTVWDAASRTLTVTLYGRGRTTVQLAHAETPREVSDNVIKTEEQENRTVYTVKLSGETQVVFKFPT